MEKKEILAEIRGQIKGLQSFIDNMDGYYCETLRVAEIELNCLEKLLKQIEA